MERIEDIIRWCEEQKPTGNSNSDEAWAAVIRIIKVIPQPASEVAISLWEDLEEIRMEIESSARTHELLAKEAGS